MSEEQIQSAIARWVRDDRLHFQIIIHDDIVHVYINRDTDEYIDHRELSETIYSAIIELEFDFAAIGLYSRILGEVEPDWQTYLEIKDAAPVEDSKSVADRINSPDENGDRALAEVELETANKEAVSETNLNNENKTSELSDAEVTPDIESIDLNKTETAELDLSQYCFIRNQRLLNADLVAPQEKIAQIVNTFHNFDESIKRSQLPRLEAYFQDVKDLNTKDLDLEVQTWWTEICELDSNTKRKLAIWLSRYCLDPLTTIATVESVFEAKAAAKKAAEETAKEKAKQEREDRSSASEYQQKSPQYNSRKQDTQQSQSNFNLNSGLIPISWILVTVAIITVSINSAKSSTSLAAICEGSENQEYCQLAVEIIGEQQLEKSSQNAPELKEESIEVGTMYCQVHGNIAAGIPLKKSDPSDNPPLSTSGAAILPGIYVADVEQTNTKNGSPTVRTVCVIEQSKAKNILRSVNILNTEQIDPDWPEVAYEPSERMKSVKSFNQAVGTYNILGKFGLNTFYTAVTLYILAVCGMAIRAYSLETIYQASFILGIVEAILATLPLLGWWIKIPLECIALGITSGCVKGFKVDWAAGYPFVAASALLLIVIRASFCWLTLAFLFFLFG